VELPCGVGCVVANIAVNGWVNGLMGVNERVDAGEHMFKTGSERLLLLTPI
jgi:hypothetical protein